MLFFGRVRAEYDENGRRSLIPTGEPDMIIEADDVLIAIGQDNAFPWIERDLGIEFGKWDIPVLDKVTFQSTLPNVYFLVGMQPLARRILLQLLHMVIRRPFPLTCFCRGEDLNNRLEPTVNLVHQKMGIHEWIYDSGVVDDERYIVPHEEKTTSLSNIKIEVELGFDAKTAFKEAQRCLNCDIQTVFERDLCIECDACVDVCPTSCITFTNNAEEEELRTKLSAPALNLSQDLYVSTDLPTGRVMVKDEDVCLHCGLCAERCPTAAWDMVKYLYNVTKAGQNAAALSY